MDFLIGLVMIVVGVVTVVKKELKLTNSMISRGGPARLAGVLLIVALPVAYVVAIVLTMIERATGSPVLGAFDGLIAYPILLIMGVAAFLVARKGTGPDKDPVSASSLFR